VRGSVRNGLFYLREIFVLQLVCSSGLRLTGHCYGLTNPEDKTTFLVTISLSLSAQLGRNSVVRQSRLRVIHILHFKTNSRLARKSKHQK